MIYNAAFSGKNKETLCFIISPVYAKLQTRLHRVACTYLVMCSYDRGGLQFDKFRKKIMRDKKKLKLISYGHL